MRHVVVALLVVSVCLLPGCLDTRVPAAPESLEPVDTIESADGIGEGFGSPLAVSPSGERAATLTTVPGEGGSGERIRVHVLERAGGGWSDVGQVIVSNRSKASDFTTGLDFGAGGDRLLVGLPVIVDGDGSETRDRAFLIDLETREPSVVEVLEPPVRGENWFGTGVALSGDGDTAFVGAHWQTEGVREGRGAVHVFDRGETGWNHSAVLTGTPLGSSEQLGSSVDASWDGDRVAVNAHEWTDIGCPDDQRNEDLIGHVFVFDRGEKGQWSQTGHLQPQMLRVCEEFGATVAMNDEGTRLVATAPTTHRSSIFVHGSPQESSWEEIGQVNASELSNGTMRRAAAISESGEMVFVGTEVNGEGPVHGFSVDEDSGLVKVADVPKPRNKSAGGFGYDVVLANETLLVAANSAELEERAGTGQIFVYDMTGLG